jgi:hypothetical protein
MRRLRSRVAIGATTAAILSLLPAAASAGVCETATSDANADITEATDAQSLVTTTGGGGALTDVDVHLEIVHPNPEQLAVYLQHATFPISPPIELSSANGEGGENYTGTILDDEALNSIVGAASPLTGRYRPETPLSTFDGQSDGGAWTITVAEGGEPTDPDVGFLDSWGVTISSDACDGPSPDACAEAKDDLRAAKTKLRKLKQRDAAQRKIRAAKRKVNKAQNRVDELCAP